MAKPIGTSPSAIRGSRTFLSTRRVVPRQRATAKCWRGPSPASAVRSIAWQVHCCGRGRPWKLCCASSVLRPVPIGPMQRLAEINYGHWEGQLWTQLPLSDPEGFAARKADMWNWQPRGGESYRALSERVAGWLGALEGDTLCVAHGGVMRVLRG